MTCEDSPPDLTRELMRVLHRNSIARRAAGLLLLGSAALVAPAAAQTEGSDQGSFRVLIDGRPAGTEEFTIRQSGVGSAAQADATGRVEVRLATGDLVLASRMRGSGMQASPLTYQVDVGGDSPSKVIGNIASGRFSAKIVTASGEQMREYVASDGAVILDDGLAHHYHFLARRVRNGRVPILIPRENRQVMATVRDQGEERLEVAGATTSAYHLVVRPDGGDERHVWVDALNRVLKVEVPARGYIATRVQLPR
jgi:hypothetical protein